MVNPLEVTYYMRTGYSPSDEPSSDAVINLNEHWTSPILLKEYDPSNIPAIKVQLTDDELHLIDFLKIKDTVTNERWYYYVAGHQRLNERVVNIRIILDAFATVGLNNISFFGNVMRRNLSSAEKANYPLLPEPWAPRRPLKIRRMIIDLNVNKTIKIPAHISTTFEENVSHIEHNPNPVAINVPNDPLGLSTFQDSLSYSADVPMGYPNAASDTSHTITTPWGSIQYITPYEQYFTLSGTALTAFLAKAKKYNALDLIETPYYLPKPDSTQNITLSELSNANTRNPKASRYYTTITIRSLASNSSRTYADSDTDLQYNQSLTVVIAPDKSGGIYVIPTTLRDTGLNAYTYLDGVYSPFETVIYNAVGDTPAKFAADGTTLLNTALNNLFQTYVNKINALQYEGMQAKYFKDLGVVKGVVMSFAADLLNSTSQTTTTTSAYDQTATITTAIPKVSQSSTQTQTVPRYTQSQSQSTTIPSHTASQYSTTNMPTVSGSSSAYNNAHSSTQQGYYYTPQNPGSSAYMPSITTNISAFNQTASTSQNSHSISQNTSINNNSTTQSSSGSVVTPEHSIKTSSTTDTSAHNQTATQITQIPAQTTTSTTVQEGSSRSVAQGNNIAVQGTKDIYEIDAWNTLRTMIFGGYRNEVHGFMLGNINDYLNRWVSIQNDMHNGKVANLFKNITLVGNYNDYNKLAGKYEILIASLSPEDEINFDLFLDHFGHAVDEYTNSLVSDVRENYNYTLVGEDAILANSVMQEANAQILNQFRAGVRVWKKPIRPENY